jgi:hypothetical protein
MTTTTTFEFPYPTLTRIEGRPTAATLTILRSEIYANALAIESDNGGGDDGHLGVVMPPTEYLARAGTAFHRPIRPGPQPDHPAGTSGAQITANNRAYDRTLATYRTYKQVDAALRKQIIQAVEPTFYSDLRDKVFGYTDISCIVFLNHLQTSYGTITAADLETNRNKLSEPWNPEEPFKKLWDRIKTIRDLAEDGDRPLDDDTVMHLTLSALEQTGIYSHTICTWCDQPATNRTWIEF